MATKLAPRHWTYDEYARLPDDGNRYEVIAGELVMTPAPRPAHQELVARLLVLLKTFADANELGRVLPAPVDVLLPEGHFLQPDVVFVCAERRHLITGRGVEGAPDLVVEVLSDSTASRDRGVKRSQYARSGVHEYWLVDPRACRIMVYQWGLDPLRPPAMAAESLVWQPRPGGPSLTVSVPGLFFDID